MNRLRRFAVGLPVVLVLCASGAAIASSYRTVAASSGTPSFNPAAPSSTSDFDIIGAQVALKSSVTTTKNWIVPLQLGSNTYPGQSGAARQITVFPFLTLSCATIYSYSENGAYYSQSGSTCTGGGPTFGNASVYVPANGTALAVIDLLPPSVHGRVGVSSVGTIAVYDPLVP
jgi:hypothetical protein